MQNQTVVVRLAEQQQIVAAAVHEEYVVEVRVLGLNHHIDTERLVSQATACLGVSIRARCTVKSKRSTGSESHFVGYSQELEVVVLVQVIAGYRFVEPERQVVAHAENAVGGFRLSEHAWRACILNTCEHL